MLNQVDPNSCCSLEIADVCLADYKFERPAERYAEMKIWEVSGNTFHSVTCHRSNWHNDTGVAQRLLHRVISNHSTIPVLVLVTLMELYITTTLLELPIKNGNFFGPTRKAKLQISCFPLALVVYPEVRMREMRESLTLDYTGSLSIVSTIFWMLKMRGTSSSKRFESHTRRRMVDI